MHQRIEETAMTDFSAFCPVDIRVLNPEDGKAAVRDALRDRRAKLLVLAPRFLCTQLSLAAFFTALQGDGHAVQLYAEVPSNPSVDDIAALFSQLAEQRFVPTAILAIGGGSCMDLGKAVSALFHLDGCQTAEGVRNAIRGKAYLAPHPFIDLLVMPTTAGTGSEVTKWATIWDAANSIKLSIDCAGCFARMAVLIPAWTANMPAGLTLSTGLDALCHAMEAYWSAHREPLSQALAASAVRIIRDTLPEVLAAPDSIALRERMCVGSLLAGLAFSRTRTTACHSISYPLTMLYAIPHGYAAAITLEAVARRNAKVVPELEALLAVFDCDEGLYGWLENVTKGIQPLRLSAFGVKAGDLPAIADKAFTAGRMDNNPVAFTPQDVVLILRECF